MDHRVAYDAWRSRRRPSVNPVHRACGYRAMALIAQCGDTRHIEQPGVLGSMRRVACHAAFRLDRSMLERERTTHVGVALGADHVLVSGGLEIVVPEGAVNVMAVAALDQSLVHLVVEGHAESRLHVGMALEAERGLSSLQQGLSSARMHAVATDASDIGLGVRRTIEVGMHTRVAALAGGVHVLGRGLGGIEDLGGIAAAVDVQLAGPVTVFTGNASAAVLQGHFGMRIGGEPLGDLNVAGCAGIGTHIVPRGNILDLGGGGFGPGRLRRKGSGAHNARAQQQHQTSSQSRQLARGRTNRQSRYWPIFMHEKYRLVCSRFIICKQSFQRVVCRTWQFPFGIAGTASGSLSHIVAIQLCAEQHYMR